MGRRRRRGRTDDLLQGVLLVDKPADLTSREVCKRVQHRLRLGKVGHGGTLDPSATGLLPLLLNGATRLMPQLQNKDKGYQARVRLGVRTDTMDPTGEVIQERDPADLEDAAIREAVATFLGKQQQRVPRYSAARVDGKRLYEYARAGEEVELPFKEIDIQRLDVLDIERTERGIDVLIDLDCSSGTYVRAIADDLGEKLGCGAHLAALRRTRIAKLQLERALALETIQDEADSGAAARREAAEEGTVVRFVPEASAQRWTDFFGDALVPVEELLSLPLVSVPQGVADRIGNGQPLRKADLEDLPDLPVFLPGEKWVLQGPQKLRRLAVVRAEVARDSLARREAGAVVFQVERLLR